MSFVQDNDEMYTYMVIEWYNKYWHIWITPSWEPYNPDNLIAYHYLCTVFYNFFFNNWFDKLFSLRSFSIFLSTILTPILYIFIKYFSNKKTALFSIFLISINWYITMTFVIARPYVFFAIWSSIASLIFIKSFLDIIKNKSINKTNLLNIVFWIILILAIFFEWHIMWTYHNIMLILFLIVYMLVKLENKKIFRLIYSILILLLIFVIYLYFFKYSFIKFIIESFIPVFKIDILSIFWNQISYYTDLWILLSILILIWIIIKTKNRKFTILVIYITTCTVFLHWYIFWSRLFSFRYLIDYLVLFLICISYFIINYKNKKIILTFIIIYLSTNIYNLNLIFSDELNRSLFYRNLKIQDYKYCNNYKNIATDSPWISYFYNKDSNIYSLPSFNDTYHIMDNSRYTYLNVYAIKNNEYLENIVEKNWSVCFAFSHSQYNDTWNFWNRALFKNVMEKWKIIKDNFIEKRIFWTWESPYSNKHNWTILIIDNSFINKEK
jgi:hypothetical protein